MTAICSGMPICGAAKPTPGAARMVSNIDAISSWMGAETISSGVSTRACDLRTRSPAWQIPRTI
jgi:predicted benzoate:H+ symporter BenE